MGMPACGCKRTSGMSGERRVILKTNIAPMLALIAVLLAVIISGCSGDAGTGENQASGSLTVSRGEHKREGGGEHGSSVEGGGDGERGGGQERPR